MRYEVLTRKPIQTLLKDLKVALAEIQFGVLFELDFKDNFNEKGIDYPLSYKVLDVCNPMLAHEALLIDQNVGYFLPCKIIIYETDPLTHLGLLKPTEMISTLGNTALMPMAEKVEGLLIEAMKKAADV